MSSFFATGESEVIFTIMQLLLNAHLNKLRVAFFPKVTHYRQDFLNKPKQTGCVFFS